MARVSPNATETLVRHIRGDREATLDLESLLQVELALLARQRMNHGEGLLQPTEIAHEAFLRLIDEKSVALADRVSFLAVTARIQRSVLQELEAQVQGPGESRTELATVTVTDRYLFAPGAGLDSGELELALRRLSKISEEQARLVELRFFGGLRTSEAGRVLGLDSRRAEKVWRLSRIRLNRELSRIRRQG